MKTKTIKKSLPKSQMGSVVKAAKVVKAVDKASDAALLAKRAAAAKKAQQAEDIRIAFQRKERSALKDKLKAADKATTPKKQMGGNAGRSISKKAADRKVAKGKGTIEYKWGDVSEPGSEGNKGDYIGYGKNAKTTVGGWKSMKDSKTPRPIRKKGGIAKAQMGRNVESYTPSNQPGGTPTAGGAILENKKSAPRTSVPKMPKMGEMTPKEKRQQKREMKSTLKYVKKHGSGLAMKKGGSIKKK